jgi:hemoglobin
MRAKEDIKTKNDIEILVTKFYNQALYDPILKGHFDLIENLEEHLPVIVDFWDGILLGASTYKGNPMLKHIQLHSKIKITKAHMDQWLMLWKNNIQILFSGPISVTAYERAYQIGQLMLYKVNDQGNGLL